MQVHILTLFPEIFAGMLTESILGMIGDTHGDGAILFQTRPLMAAGVFQFTGVRLMAASSGSSMRWY